MRAASWLLAGLCPVLVAGADDNSKFPGPSYSPASIVNAATNLPNPLAPNTIATVYGANLSFSTRVVTPEDLRGGSLPSVLIGTGVRVLVASIPASVYFVSPTQINFLIPSNLRAGLVDLQIVRDGRAGPIVQITLTSVAPALFQADTRTAVATMADGSVITWDAPARPGDFVVLYAVGLGPTVPDPGNGQLPKGPAPIQRMADFHVLLDGMAVDSRSVAYAGVAPGFAGLYQVNLRLPESLADGPEIRLGVGDQISPPGIRLPVRTKEELIFLRNPWQSQCVY